jgi:hypothetical protein
MQTKKVLVEIELPEDKEIFCIQYINANSIAVHLTHRKPKELKFREVVGATEILPGQYWSPLTENRSMNLNIYSFDLTPVTGEIVWELVDANA